MTPAEKPKILFVVQSLIKGGAERLVLDISNDLLKRDLAEVIIAALDKRNDYPGLSANIDVRVCPITYKLSMLRKNIIDLASLRKLTDDFKPDIIHTHCYFQEAPPREYPIPGITYFTHLHDYMPEFAPMRMNRYFSKKGITSCYEKRRLIKKYRLTSNSFLAISRDMYDYFYKSLPPDLRKRIYMLPNAINYYKFHNEVVRHIKTKRPVRLINIGHAAPKKNQVFLIAVLDALRKKGLDAHLELVGDLHQSEHLIRHEINKYGLEKNVSCPGLVEHVEERLQNSDIYVHSATSEPFGLVMLEAMAAGLPVVCLDAGGNRDIIEDGKNGFMIQRPDAELFAGRIIELVNNDALYAEMSRYASQYAAGFDISHYTDRLLSMYHAAIAEKRTSTRH